jgi:hypothetical protein
VHVHVARGHERQVELAPELLQRRKPPSILAGGEQLDRDPETAGEDGGEPGGFGRVGLGGGEPEGQQVGSG